MTGRIQILPCTLAHLRALGPKMRPGDRAEIDAPGLPCRHVLFSLWRNSAYRKAAFVDGEIAAAWGCAGPILSSVGEAWLFTSPAVERVQVSFIRVARLELDRMLIGRQSLVSGVATDYKKAVRFVETLGFRLGREFPVGPAAVKFREIRVGQ